MNSIPRVRSPARVPLLGSRTCMSSCFPERDTWVALPILCSNLHYPPPKPQPPSVFCPENGTPAYQVTKPKTLGVILFSSFSHSPYLINHQLCTSHSLSISTQFSPWFGHFFLCGFNAMNPLTSSSTGL